MRDLGGMRGAEQIGAEKKNTSKEETQVSIGIGGGGRGLGGAGVHSGRLSAKNKVP